MLKSQRILTWSVSSTLSGTWSYHFDCPLTPYFLHKTQWITLANFSCLPLYSVQLLLLLLLLLIIIRTSPLVFIAHDHAQNHGIPTWNFCLWMTEIHCENDYTMKMLVHETFIFQGMFDTIINFTPTMFHGFKKGRIYLPRYSVSSALKSQTLSNFTCSKYIYMSK